ncbi:hypothetical protein PybrP1_012439 [[Pythium] brassicae (nom. inval.)]|nr:hypothetical protein PybrP1_012439 [[Pythium] brassicae (nom. inval.)]
MSDDFHLQDSWQEDPSYQQGGFPRGGGGYHHGQGARPHPQYYDHYQQQYQHQYQQYSANDPSCFRDHSQSASHRPPYYEQFHQQQHGANDQHHYGGHQQSARRPPPYYEQQPPQSGYSSAGGDARGMRDFNSGRHQPSNRGRYNNRGRGRGRSHGRKSGGQIPDNWSDVPKLGDLVRDSRFVPMRCPLDAKFAHLHSSPEDAWSPQLFVAEQERRGLNVGLVIDLTNTSRYYDGAAEFRDTSIEYAKLPIEGFNAPPREDDVGQFIAIVDAFLEKRPTARIAVHCTHGLNRTGYLIVQYLVRKLGCSVKHALGSFSLARPPGLIKHQYVEALYRLLGEGEEVELPTLPAWAADKYGKRR